MPHETEGVAEDLALQAQDDRDIVLKQPHPDEVAPDTVADLPDAVLVGGLAEEPDQTNAGDA